MPTEAEDSHYGMAKRILGADWKGDAEDAYAEMWRRGWVRVVDYGDRIFAERYAAGKPVKMSQLTCAQTDWLEGQVRARKVLYWNDELFSLTTEAKQGQAAEIVHKLPTA